MVFLKTLFARLSIKLHLSDSVKLIGNVPYSDVVADHSVMDVLVYPRRSSRNTEMVTPLKPLEAMAMGKAVIGSDVGGIRELISPGTGMLFSAGTLLIWLRNVPR